MLLHEMLDATIQGSQVRLERVLSEPGFMDQIAAILAIKSRLLLEIETPMGVLMGRVNQALASTAGELGQATTREVAVCLRDAIYSIEQGLVLRWLECDTTTTMKETVPLCHAIEQFENLAQFADALRRTLPWGAHLARIGESNTAIGIKQPGKIAFLSSMSINHHGGGMHEGRAQGQNMASHLDLDTAIERYPHWFGRVNIDKAGLAVRHETHPLDQLSKLPRDRLIWLAMLIEIASQRMANTDPSCVDLSENISRALPAIESATQQHLPALITSNWIASELSVEKALVDLRFTPWELSFLAPAVEGLSVTAFLPYGDDEMGLNLQTRELTKKPSLGYFDGQDWNARHVQLTTMQTDWVGTRAETEKARKLIFASNLAKYLLTWGNAEFGRAWESNKEWFKHKLTANLDRALQSSCATLADANYSAHAGVHLYSQSPKHKTYNPRCYFDPKKLVTDVVRLVPQCERDLIEILGLSGTEELPPFLRGWSRMHDWTTVSHMTSTPSGCRWNFANPRNHLLEASICLNKSNLPPSVSHVP